MMIKKKSLLFLAIAIIKALHQNDAKIKNAKVDDTKIESVEEENVKTKNVT